MAGAASPDLDSTSRWIRTTAKFVFFAVLPLAWVFIALGVWFGSEKTGFDLRNAFLPAAHDVLRGDSPYPALGDAEIVHQHAYVYTPFVAYLLTPLTVFATGTAVKIGTAACFLAALGVLWLVGVRDWRCYTVALVWPPVINCAGNAAISLFLALALAAAWRWRCHELRSGTLLGATIAAKTFAWPMLLWPLVLGRLRGSVTAFAVAVGLSLGTWALIGFQGLRGYPDLLRAVTRLEEENSFSVSGALLSAGAGLAVSRGVTVALTIGLIALAVGFGRRRDESRAFVTLLLASLVATPILWQHYLVLLLVALAVTQPRLSAGWLLPLSFYLAPWVGNGALWQTVLVPIMAAAVGVTCLFPRQRDVADQAHTAAALPQGQPLAVAID